MLFVGNGNDHVVPISGHEGDLQEVPQKSKAITEYVEYADRPHFPGVPGWELVADRALDWAVAHATSRLPAR